jgi:CubicO group peptidase (beta-lactamase class C family)
MELTILGELNRAVEPLRALGGTTRVELQEEFGNQPRFSVSPDFENGVREFSHIGDSAMSQLFGLLFIAILLITGCARGPDTLAYSKESEPVEKPKLSGSFPEGRELEEALHELTEIVHGYVREDKTIGAELAIVKNGEVILHEVAGLKDREENTPLEPNTVYNIRSMTKPLTGAIAQILIDEGKLALQDTVSQYLAAFDNEKSKTIAIEHLLTQTSGFPIGNITSFQAFPSLRDQANRAGQDGPIIEPGTQFTYSDIGTDVLAAVLEEVTGTPIDQLIAERLLIPLGMSSTFTYLSPEDDRGQMISSAYVGKEKAWIRYWHPGIGPMYIYPMGSQSFYSTPLDYARFLAMWMNGGLAGGRQVISRQGVKRTLIPIVKADGVPTTFPNHATYYGQMALLYMERDETGQQTLRIIGHSGSDGTIAWAWPELDLIILYFTQSRLGETPFDLERWIYSLLINPDWDPVVPEVLKAYAGRYLGNFSIYAYDEFEVVAQGGSFAVEMPGQPAYALRGPDSNGWFTLDFIQDFAFSFEKNQAGDVVLMKLHQAGAIFELPRLGTDRAADMLLELNELLKGWQKYLGSYYDEQEDVVVKVIMQNNTLALEIPDIGLMELTHPDEEGRWTRKLNPVFAVSVIETADGEVVSHTAHTPQGDFVRFRVNPED